MGGIVEGSAQRYCLIRSMLDKFVPAPARLVELGAAPGDQAASLAHLGYLVTAVDLGEAPDAWAGSASGRMEHIFDEAGVRYVEWDLAKTPYPLDNDEFDAVVMTEVFEHLREYPLQSLVECRRILRPGGRLFFTTPNAAYVLNRARALKGLSTATSVDDWMYGVPYARHAREYTFAEVQQMMSAAGFDVILAESRHLFKSAGKQTLGARTAKQFLDRLAMMRNTLGPSIIIIAEKPAK